MAKQTIVNTDTFGQAFTKQNENNTEIYTDIAARPLLVSAYGAVGDGSNDDTSAIQACFTAAGAGDTVYFDKPSASYRITSHVQVNTGVIIEGSGSTISCTGNGRLGLHAVRIILKDLTFTGDRTTGIACLTLSQNYITVQNVKIELFDIGINLIGGVWHNIFNIRMRNIKTTVVSVGDVVGTVVTDLRYDTDTGTYSQPTRGILLNGEGCNFSDLDIIHAGVGVEIAGSATHTPTWNFFNSCAFDSSTNGCTITSSVSGSSANGTMFQHCWFSSHTGYGVVISGTQTLDGVTFNGCHFLNNSYGAISISGTAQNIDINACVFSGNSVGNSGTYPTIYTNAAGRKLVRNSFFTSWGNFTTTVKADIERGSSDGVIVIDGNASLGSYTGAGLVDASSTSPSTGTNFGGLPSTGGGLTDVVNDTTPQLGGNLDMNGKTIGGNTEAQLDSAVSNTHTQSHTFGSHSDVSYTGTDVNDAIAKKHAESHTAASHSDIDSSGATIEDAVSKRHNESHAITSHSDYEVGVYVPSFTCTGSVTLNSSYNYLAYTKTGRVVVITGEIRLSAESASGTLQVSIPFAINNPTAIAGQFAGSVTMNNVSGLTNWGSFKIRGATGSTVYIVHEETTGFTYDTSQFLTSTTAFNFGFTYITS